MTRELRLGHWVVLRYSVTRPAIHAACAHNTGPRHGAACLRHSVARLRHGVARLRHGVARLRHGVARLRHGVARLRHGVARLRHGVARLRHGRPLAMTRSVLSHDTARRACGLSALRAPWGHHACSQGQLCVHTVHVTYF